MKIGAYDNQSKSITICQTCTVTYLQKHHSNLPTKSCDKSIFLQQICLSLQIPGLKSKVREVTVSQ